MEIDKNEMSNSRQCRSFVDKMIVELFPTSAGAWPSKLMFWEEASSTLIVALMFEHTRTRNLFNDDYQLIVNLFLNPNCEGARADVASATIYNKSIELIDVLSSEGVVGRLDMYRTKVLLYRTMVLMARLTKVRR
jgi:hypothetical protein